MAEELFQIGEVAKLYHVSVGTLRHYEQAGLLKPEYTDPDTGYRYYSVRQFEQLTNIRYLRALGLPLQEIAAYLQNRDADTIAEALRRQKALVQQKKQELDIIERKLDHRLAQLEKARTAQLDSNWSSSLPCALWACGRMWRSAVICGWNTPSAGWNRARNCR